MAKKILIIDDDPEYCEELSMILKDERHCVETACDSAQGERLVRENSYDIVLLDFKMPGLNGIELIKKIKQINSKTKAFLISGRPFMDNLLKDQAASCLIEGFMSKPLDIEKLLKKIQDIL